ncbi:MAG: NrdH-redoxin [SAR202 cluster bacterium]|nr:NrdH-redoxin [Chloroflexota bacterium]MQG39522.1 NrdH-redoxin [SAR202 cluster bacterium]
MTVYGADWCSDCKRSKRLLDSKNIRYIWIDVDNNEAALQTVKSLNQGKRIIPTIIFPNGDILVEPTDSELSSKL